jgi:hypothetical protein
VPDLAIRAVRGICVRDTVHTMTKSPAAKPARKRPTREQFDERLSIPLGSKQAVEPATELDPDSPEAIRQRVRDRAGEEPPPKGTGRPRK